MNLTEIILNKRSQIQDRNKNADAENGLEDTGRGRVSWDKARE